MENQEPRTKDQGTHRLRLTIAYDGRPWRGWQSQPGRQTVQDEIEKILAALTCKRISVQGSGRTDAGVHARAQVAHITVEDSAWSANTWLRALNAKLPASIRIVDCEEVPLNFHSRFDATGKVYEYRIWLPAVLSPFEVGLSWHPFGKLDIGLIREGARLLVGTHNFARLSANRGEMSEIERREDMTRLVRTVKRVDVFEEGDVLRIECEGDGFMYKMVRLMVGSLVRVARGKSSLEWLRSLVNEPDGEKSNFCAPPDGLYLLRVLYDGNKPSI